MVNSVRIVMLLTDGFGGTGGIAKFNRDFLQALDACADVQRVHALPRLIPVAIDEPVPESVVYDRAAARGKFAFIRRVLAHAWRRGPAELVICGHINLLPAAWLLARLRRARLALILHGVEAWTRKNAPTGLLMFSVDAFIAVSRHTAERTAAWSKVPAGRFVILPNCVDLDRFLPQPRDANLVERYGFHGSRVLLTVGRLAGRERSKGFDRVIEAMPRLLETFPDLKYLIVGNGDDRRRLQEKARSLGMFRQVIFAGNIPEDEKVAHYSLADAFVMPSHGEGFGIVLIEAAACGVPVIGSLADGSREALLEGRLGRLVDPNNAIELIDAVTTVLATKPARVRNDAITFFDMAHFRARVASWIRAQAGLSPRAPAQAQ
jgi:phosphatidylinositol alpha-1,6-mannosyltransferase